MMTDCDWRTFRDDAFPRLVYWREVMHPNFGSFAFTSQAATSLSHQAVPMYKVTHRVEDYVYCPPMPLGVVETYAGSLANGGRGGHRLTVELSSMWSCCLSGDGGLFTANILNNTIVKIDRRGEANIYAGTGMTGTSNGPRRDATFSSPAAVHLLKSGHLLVGDKGNNLIRIVKSNDQVEYFAGTGENGIKDGPYSSATFSAPVGITETSTGVILVCDNSSRLLRMLIGGYVSTFRAPVSIARSAVSDPTGATFDPVTGKVYVVSRGNCIDSIDSEGRVESVASNDEIPEGKVRFCSPWTAITTPSNELIIADEYSHRLQTVNLADGSTDVLCGAGIQGFEDGPAANAQFQHIACMDLTPLGDVLIADRTNHLVRRIRVPRFQTRNFDVDKQLSLIELTEVTVLPMTTLKFANGVETSIHTALLESRCRYALEKDCQISLSSLDISLESISAFHSYIYTDAIAPVDENSLAELMVRSIY